MGGKTTTRERAAGEAGPLGERLVSVKVDTRNNEDVKEIVILLMTDFEFQRVSHWKDFGYWRGVEGWGPERWCADQCRN